MADAYDLIAIGSGQAGESATELAFFFGHRSEVIERARPGGTVTSGGTPTKTLREAAIYFSGLSEGDVYGVRISTPPLRRKNEHDREHVNEHAHLQLYLQVCRVRWLAQGRFIRKRSTCWIGGDDT
jgi:pyruvate/2-oxoglutarate dehydrogenase complex dihydrolipoamide dehydrogenase (E3) component